LHGETFFSFFADFAWPKPENEMTPSSSCLLCPSDYASDPKWRSKPLKSLKTKSQMAPVGLAIKGKEN
jgi:hypothetical protein